MRMDRMSFARERAESYFSQGFNCAESVLAAMCDTFFPDRRRTAVCFATALGGGLGRCECLCGALNGAAMAVGAAVGRTDPSEKEKKDAAYAAIAPIFRAFKERFGSTCCAELNHGDFISAEHRRRCTEIVGWTAGAVAARLEDLTGGVSSAYSV